MTYTKEEAEGFQRGYRSARIRSFGRYFVYGQGIT